MPPTTSLNLMLFLLYMLFTDLEELELINSQVGLEWLHLHGFESPTSRLLLVYVVLGLLGDFGQSGCQLERRGWDPVLFVVGEVSRTNGHYVVQVQFLAHIVVLDLVGQDDLVALGDQKGNVVDFGNGI